MKFKNIKNAVAFSLISLATQNVLAVEVSKDINYDLDASNDQIQILNLSGTMTVIPSKDNKLHVRGKVVANAKSESKAEALLNAVKFDFLERGNKDILTLEYPIDEYTGFVYNPENKKGWNSNSTSKYMGQRVKVASRASRRGKWANVYADLTIEVPKDQSSLVLVKMGQINARDLDANLVLDTSSGKINIKDSAGRLSADSGSGRITVEDYTGHVTADTGSGGIDLINIKGDIVADSGSGGVVINSVTGRVEADTGSGSVKVTDYLGGDLLKVDTGSGGVRVSGDLSKVEDLKIDTGSGGVTLVTTQPPSLDLDIDTGSGGISVDLPNLNVKRDKRGEFLGTVGSGRGSANIETGSGGVRFRMDESYEFDRSVSIESKKKEESKQAQSENLELTKRIRSALNADANIRKANLKISSLGDKAVIEGTLENVWDIGKAIKIASEVEGVDGVQADLDVK